MQRKIAGIILFLIWAPAAKGTVTILPGEENAIVFNDLYPTSFGFNTPVILASGDFNGDGRDDVAVDLPRTATHQEIYLFFGGSSGNSVLSSDADVKIIMVDASNYSPTLTFSDLDGDGKKDLVIGSPALSGDKGEILVIRGSASPPSVIDLNTVSPDLRIVGKAGSILGQSLAVGDFNGDGREDLLAGAPGVNESYLVLGGSVAISGTLDLSVSQPLPTVQGTGFTGIYVTAGDFNGDGKDDLALSSQNNNEIYVIYGRSVFPPLWVLGSPPADVTVQRPSEGIIGIAAGDLTGDGRDELVVQSQPNLFNVSLWTRIVAGSDMTPGAVIVLPFSGGHLIPIGSVPGRIRCGDFDGDGKPDLFFMVISPSYGVKALLSTDLGTGGIDLDNISLDSLVFDGAFEALALADLNGDGHKDLVVYHNFGYTVQAPYGGVKCIFGFEPLRNPSVHINPRTPSSPRVRLTLGVGGNPVEMKLSGDLADSFANQWIPYRVDPEVLFTPSAGTKTVRAVFRNQFGRESATAQDTMTLTVGSPGVVTGRNRLSRGGTVSFDCHITESTHLRARVFNDQGEQVKDLVDATVDAGVQPVIWDGFDSNGRRVSPGLYFLVMELHGERLTKNILVE